MADSETIDEVDGHYNEESDEDFDPDAAAAQPQRDSSDDEDSQSATNGKRTASDAHTINQEIDFDNSGDESTIAHGKKRKRRKTAQKIEGDGDGNNDDDDGGEGGFVRTRAQRRAEGTERKALTDASTAKVDVNALWAAMSAPQQAQGAGEQTTVTSTSDMPSDKKLSAATALEASESDSKPSQQPSTSVEAMVTIKRKYDFAGQVIEEERQVPASSAEAKLYLEEQSRSATLKPAVNRPKKRKTPFGAFGGASIINGSGPVAGKKLTTLEKSKLDWAAHIDKEGIADELDEASRAKGSYMGKVDFLDRMNNKRDEELRRKP